MRNKTRQAGFSLVELLVVVAIIGLLVAIALPSFSRAKIQAKNVGTRAIQASISTGLSQFREERALGNTLPPSASDVRDGNGMSLIQDPIERSGSGGATVRVNGASLLVYALAGADNQGTAGFRPFGAATWSESMNNLYNQQAAVPAPRYGPYAGAELFDRVQRIAEIKTFPIQDVFQTVGYTDSEKLQRVFVDDFGGPILYYKSRPAARAMITNPGNVIGVYDHRDNMLLTSYPSSLLANTNYAGDNDFAKVNSNTGECDSFDCFILDDKASRLDGSGNYIQAAPVNAQDFLLISAGADGRFGTKDDITNWK